MRKTNDEPWSTDTVTSTYNNRLRTNLSLGQPTGVWTNELGYDAAKRLTSVTSPAGIFTYTLGGAGAASPPIKKISLPNTSYITNSFDTVARLLGTWLKNNTNGTLDSAAYAYNSGNQRTTFTNAAGTYLGYTYDPIGQLKVADSSVSSEDRGYQYDAAWNLSQRTNNVVVWSYSYNSKNELTGVGNWWDCSSDGNGNRTYEQNSGHSSEGFDYDDENRLRNWYAYDDRDGGDGSPTSADDLRTEFGYDGQGRLRQRVEYTSDGTDWIWASATRYVYDGRRVIQERDGNNVPTVSYTRGTDLSGSLEGAGGIGGLLGRSHGYSAGNWSTHNFYHADGNGNVTYLVNSSQGLAASYRYDPFGNLISSSGSLAGANTYRFSSKEIHVNSGLYYYGERFYDPNTQRWPNRDPLGDFRSQLRYARTGTQPLGSVGDKYYLVLTRYPFEFSSQGRNLYAFVRNQPVLLVDIYGLSDWKWTWWDLITFYPHGFYDIGYGIQDGLCKIPETFNNACEVSKGRGKELDDDADPSGNAGGTMGGGSMNSGIGGIGQGVKGIITGLPNTTMTGPTLSGCTEADFIGQALQQTIISNGTP